MGVATVELLLYPGVNNQFREGELVVDGQQPSPLLRGFLADTGLDGHRHPGGQAGENIRQQPLQLIGIAEHTGALALGGDGAAGAAQIEVDLRIAHVRHLPGGPQEMVGAVGEDLGDHGQALVVHQLIEFLGLELIGGVGGHKGGKIAVGTAEKIGVDGAPEIVGHALQRGGIELHGVSPFKQPSSVMPGQWV